PIALLEEIEELRKAGIDLSGRLLISHQAHLVMPYHKLLDRMAEEKSPREKIGTTGRGIGPAYVDKIARTGIRIVDLLDHKVLREKLRRNIEEKNLLLSRVYQTEELDEERIVREYMEFDQRIDPFVKDVSVFLSEAIREGKRILLEGAQGTLLDIDAGTYPFVTSSSAGAGGALTGLGIGPRCITRVLGVMKAYTTRVGHGPFPTELSDDFGQRLRETGGEYGATTGRPRRCGWFDAVIAQYSARVNGVDAWAVTKLDVLTGVDPLRICVAYEDGRRTYRNFPAVPHILEACRPVYEELPGWTEPIERVRTWDALPINAQNYLRFIEDLTQVPVVILSVGPEQEMTIVRNSSF
ncbi:MAG: adenylosuccinate synthase, partial [Calditrichaeota bacterium]|nr:adenylosuccinate synthase [Calditrichota bacterium]